MRPLTRRPSTVSEEDDSEIGPVADLVSSSARDLHELSTGADRWKEKSTATEAMQGVPARQFALAPNSTPSNQSSSIQKYIPTGPDLDGRSGLQTPAIRLHAVPAREIPPAPYSASCSRSPSVQIYIPLRPESDERSPTSRLEFMNPFQPKRLSQACQIGEEPRPNPVVMPQPLKHSRILNHSEISNDGARDIDSEVIDFAALDSPHPDTPPMSDGSVSPTSVAQDSVGYIIAINKSEDLPKPHINGTLTRATRNTLVEVSIPRRALPSEPAASELAVPVLEMHISATPPSETLQANVPDVKASSMTQAETDVPPSDQTRSAVLEPEALAIPVNVTDEADVLHSSYSKRHKARGTSKSGRLGKNKFRRCYRMGRRMVLRKHVLQVVVGRKLAESTKEDLRMSSMSGKKAC